jgi:putative nucleotidyltransferase-like protein
MGRALPRSPEVVLALDLLHPARGPSRSGGERVTAALAPGWLSRVAADKALARAAPVLVARLAAAGALESLSPADRAHVEAVSAFGAARALAIRGALAPLGDACASERVPVHLVKGAALHGLLYADPAERPSADVDLFVLARHVPRLHALLVRLGFSPDEHSAARVEAVARHGDGRPWLVDLSYGAPAGDLVIEVKSDPVAVGRPPRRIDAFAEGATPSPVYPGLLVPSAETMVVQQAMSLARRPEPDLLAHAELAGVLWARREELDPRRLLALVRGDGTTGILRGVLCDTDAAFPGVVPRALLCRRGSPAGYVPPRIRRGTFSPPRRETAWTRLSFWAAPALGLGNPLKTLAWLRDRLVPPQPLLAALTDGRHGPAAVFDRIARLALPPAGRP